mgnify:CR=1 FL=1|jgi:hypothetical protein|nr:MAG TPA: tail protein [Siphoviridae sp. ct2ef27]
MDDKRRDVAVERYYPSVLAPAKEFKTLAAMEDAEFKTLWDLTWQWFLNTFVYEFDIAGAQRWESMLRITPPAESSLEDRRAAILRRINTQLPYTLRRLQEILDAEYGESMAVASTNTDYELWLDIDNRIMLQVNGLRVLVQSIIPANLTINVGQTMPSNGGLYAGGTVSMAEAVRIETNTDFSMPAFTINAENGGTVSVRQDLFIASEAI